jgi:hypothetical protein
MSNDMEQMNLLDEFQPLVENGTLKAVSKNFNIWDHVPQYGYRMEMIYEVNDEDYIHCDYEYAIKKIFEILNTRDMDKVIKYAKSHHIEITFSPTPHLLFISTLFLDDRRKLK